MLEMLFHSLVPYSVCPAQFSAFLPLYGFLLREIFPTDLVPVTILLDVFLWVDVGYLPLLPVWENHCHLLQEMRGNDSNNALDSIPRGTEIS